MNKRFVFIFFTLALLKVEAQTISDSIVVDGNYRTFHFPAAKIDPGASLVFVLHGSGGNGRDMMKSAIKLDEKARSENALVVYPDGYKKYWNECRKAASSLANKEDINEGAFFDGMISYFKTKYKINDQNVFAVGTSGGGHMCYKIAMTMPGKFRAVTAIIANLPDTDNMDCMESKKAIPIMIVNGTADPLNRYEGGMMQSGSFIMGN
ncbi:MAG: poly(3-hydroxybutyrate) depolymerase, partial [Marivirga sp.]|nr:poly(3-hydroxybutyrate) depolymerase [Marivirga sp.]